MENKLLNKVIVYGGGVIGNLTSLCIQRNGFDVYQVKTDFKNIKDRTYALSPSSVAWMRLIGLRNEFIDSIHPIENIEINRNNSIANFSADAVFEPALAYMVSEKKLLQEIQRKIDSVDIKIFTEPDKINIDNSSDKVLIELEKKSVEASILIACDGASSRIKEQLNIRKKIKDFKQNAIVFTFETSTDPVNKAKQYFLEDSILALLPLSSKTISVVWSCDQDFFEKLNDMNDLEFINKLKSIIGREYEDICNISNKNDFPLTMILNDKLFDKRVVLMGNAAHSIHPLAGQGLNLGIRDIINFEKCLTSSQYKDIGLPGFLRSYERSRRIDIFEFSTMTSVLQWLFSSKSQLINKILINSIKILESKENLKNLLIKKAIS
jgi:ubiquinone biosynthesis UbiH/UbiF/VisC/COQ6 family hydroxylase